VGHVARIGAINAYKILVGKPEEKRPLEKTCAWLGGKCKKWVGGREGVVWMHLVQDSDRWRAPVNTAMKLRVP
jgi:hypothetical protein